MKYIIWGLGAVGTSFLKKMKENDLLIPNVLYCVEPNLDKRQVFLDFGGLDNHFINGMIERENYLAFLNDLDAGDYLLDFASEIKNLDVLKYCLEHNIHYLFTADSSWNPDPTWISVYQHFREYVKLKENSNNTSATSIVAFGTNPGLVSAFVKMGIREIVKKDTTPFVKRKRQRLEKLLENNKFNVVAKELGITHIQEVDNDDHIVKIPIMEDTIYSTWSPQSFFFETISQPELVVGTNSEYKKYPKTHKPKEDKLHVTLFGSAFKHKEKTYSPQGIVGGHVSSHEEVFTIQRYLTFKKYKPTVCFVYSPCACALKSVENLEYGIPAHLHLYTKDEIESGGESVGVIIQGKHFKTRYFGNYINSNDIDGIATIEQVSSSAFAAFIYMSKHPNEGMLFPEELNEEEVLETAKKYQYKYISVTVDRVAMNCGKER